MMRLLYDVAVAFCPVWTYGNTRILLYVRKTVVKELRCTRTVLNAFLEQNA